MESLTLFNGGGGGELGVTVPVFTTSFQTIKMNEWIIYLFIRFDWIRFDSIRSDSIRYYHENFSPQKYYIGILLLQSAVQ